jgi:DNA-binding transcriptional LysR family regulator
MISTDDLRFFSIVAESPSLAAAARSLDVSSSAVTQRLRLLEGRIGVRLVDRSTRHLTLTAEGELLSSRGRRLIADVKDLAELLASRRGTVTGHLRIAAPFGFGRRFVAPAAAQFRMRYPETSIGLDLLDNPVSDKSKAWDIIVHIGELTDSAMQMRVLARNDRILCASPDYLTRRGVPDSPKDLRHHECAALRENSRDATHWRFNHTSFGTESVRINPVMSSNDGAIVRNWALAGLAIVVRSEWDVAEDLRAGRLVRLLPEWSPPSADVVALLGSRHGRAARTTHFLQLLQEILSPTPWRKEPLLHASLDARSVAACLPPSRAGLTAALDERT